MAPVTPQLRHARWAVSALFWLNGATMASMVPRYPQLRDSLNLTNSWFGVAVAIGPVGGLIAGLMVARLLRGRNAGQISAWAQIVQIALMCAVLSAPNPWFFVAALVAMSASDAVTDIGMNAHGLRVEQHYGRAINNSFHAFWSLGAVAGGLIGSVLAGFGVRLFTHGLIVAALLLGANVALRRFLLPGPDHDPEAHAAAPSGRIPPRLLLHLLALGAIAAFGASIEDAGFTWSALYLRDSLGASPAVAGMGVVCVVGAQTIGRFGGDRLVDRLGDRGAARLGAGVATVGMGAALSFPSVWSTLIGLACAGWGVATLVPAAFYTAHHLPGVRPGVGLPIVNWMLRVAFFVGPPIVGRLSDRIDFRTAMAVMPAATLMVLLLSGALAARRTHEA